MTVSEDVRLAGAFNARVFTSAVTGRPWLVRSSALDALTPEGAETLRSLGVVRVLDLRAAGEGGVAAHDIDVRAMPVYDPAERVPVTGRIEDILERVLTTRGEALAAVVEAIAAATAGGEAVAVHCTIGKDRTGLVVALTLLAAGAAEVDVVADYVRSGPGVLPHRLAYVERVLGELDLTPEEHRDAMRLQLQSPPEALGHAFDLLRPWASPSDPVGASEYLIAHGLSRDALAVLRPHMAPSDRP
jgi:protein tyrosine/serine phosphatase